MKTFLINTLYKPKFNKNQKVVRGNGQAGKVVSHRQVSVGKFYYKVQHSKGYFYAYESELRSQL